MRALTVYPYYASAIAAGEKLVENRKKPPPGTVTMPFEMAIHASAPKPLWRTRCAVRHLAILWPQLFCRADVCRSVVAVVDVVRCRPIGPWLGEDDWATGPHCWQLDNVRALADPVPCRGQQGLWRLPEGVEAAVRAQLGAA